MASEPITSFSGANGSRITVDGYAAGVQNASKSWSLTSPNSRTLQFSVHSGDHWSSPGYSDSTAERSEIALSPNYAQGTQVNVAYQLTVQPGPANTASWLALNQLKQNSNGSPAFFVGMVGEHMQIGINTKSGQLVLWKDPNPIQRGHAYDMNVQLKMDPSGNGFVDVWRDGVQVVNYHGATGMAGESYYWKEGVYRGPAPETFTASFSNLDIWTGAAPAPTQPTTPTTPTSPTTPPNLAPTVTQASATPDRGIQDNGDTITFTLGFSEAVRVTGRPTLSLNDGGTATYVGGSGTSSLTFKTTVAPTDKDTSALAITGVNLASGASIKDTSGLAANLSGAVKTFTGLQIDATPTSPTTPTTPTAPTSSVTRPVLTIADNTLSVTRRRGAVDLGTKVATTDPNDRVTVKVTGLPRYETITTSDGRTFRGNNITLTAAQVNSGLELRSYYRGGAPAATLTLTASAKDPVTGAVTSAAPQTITVTDPRRAATTTTTAQQTNTVTNPASSTSTSSGLLSQSSARQPRVETVTSTAAPTAPQPTVATDATAASAGFLANQGFAMLRGHMDPATSTLGTSRLQTVVTDPQPSTGATTASLASQSFALLNQYLAGNTGRVDPGQIATAVSQPTGWAQQAILARSQH